MSLKKSIGLILVLAFVSCSGKPNIDELIAKGDKLVSENQLTEAVLQYRLAEQADPNRGDVRMKLADAYLKQRDLRSALGEGTRGADLLPNDAAAQLKAGDLLLMARHYEDAKGRADKALALDPKNADALILKGNAMAGLRDYDGALTEYQEALVLNPLVDQVYANIGAIQFVQGQVKEAEDTFKKAIDLAPKSVPARLALANFYAANKQAPETERVLKEALAMDPANASANQMMGTFYIATGKPAQAEPYFKNIAENLKTDSAQMSLADYYIALKKPDEARAILQPLSEKPASYEPATLRLAAIEYSFNKNRPRALEMVEKILVKSPKYTGARLFQLRVHVASGQGDQVLLLANALVKDEPNSLVASEALQAIGMVESGRDRTEEAQKAFQDAIQIEPRSVPSLLGLADVHLRAGRLDEAEQYARLALQVQTRNPMARAMVVRLELLRGNTAKASMELAALEKDFPNTVPVLTLVAARELASGRTEAARTAFTKVLSVDADNLEALQGVSLIDIRANRKKEAVDRIEASLKRTPPSADRYILASRIHQASGNPARAEELLKAAIDKEPSRLAAYMLLGQFYVGQRRLPDARDQFKTLVSKNPRSVSASTMLAMLYEIQKDLPAAEKQYQQTLLIDPESGVAANNLAWIYVASGRNLDQAIDLAQVGVRKLPNAPQPLDTLGWAYYKKGMHAQAVQYLESSIAKDASDPMVHYHLGMAHFKRDELEKAKKSLQKALSMSQTFEGVEEAKKTLAGLGK